jgi:hypothetical protein
MLVLDPARSQEVSHLAAELGVAVEQYIPVLAGQRQRLPQLLYDPIARRVRRDIEMLYLATAMFQHNEHEQHLHRDRGHVKKSIETICLRWLCTKVFQAWLGRRGNFRRSRETVRSEISMPSIFNSP